MTSLNWIKKLDPSLFALEERPQFGGRIDFSWEAFQDRLRDVFQIPLSLRHETKGWTDSAEVVKGTGEKMIVMPIYLAPLSASLYFVTSLQDVQRLMTLLFASKDSSNFFFEKGFAKGFFSYFGLEILKLLSEMKAIHPFSPRLGEVFDLREKPFDEKIFLIDVALSAKEENFWGKIVIPSSFREEWKAFFARESPLLSEELKSEITVELGLEIGYSQFSYQEWSQVRKGDFILLDRCSYDFQKKQGGGFLRLQDRALFRVKYKKESIEIINYPVYEEVTKMIEDNEDEDEESFFDEEEMEFPEIEEEAVQSEENVGKISAEDLPIRVSIEAAHLTMSVKELMELAPGSVVDLQVSPEKGVDLVVNGKKIGHGELLRVGEMLGVRILSI